MKLLKSVCTRQLFLLAVMLFVTCALHAQQSVTVHLRLLPNQLRAADIWEQDLFSSSATPLRVYLVVTVTDSKNSLVLTATSSQFQLTQGMKSLSAATLAGISPIRTDYGSSRVRDVLARTGSFPPGDYVVCAYIRGSSAASGNPQTLAEDCVEQHVEGAYDILLISPANETSVDMKYPVFSWVQPTPTTLTRGIPSMVYSLRIVEILGKQSSVAAMEGNPSWFERQNIGAPVLQYPPSARNLEKGHRYAWSIAAFAGDVLLGKSEVWEFVFEPPSIAAGPVKATESKYSAKSQINVLEELLRSCTEDVQK